MANRNVIVIAASAGGVQALSALVAELPGNIYVAPPHHHLLIEKTVQNWFMVQKKTYVVPPSTLSSVRPHAGPHTGGN